MKYLKAFPVNGKPFTRWGVWANSLEELTQMGEQNNPLIIAENLVPAYQYGVSPKHIVNGVLTDFTQSEMAEFAQEYSKRQYISAYGQQLKNFAGESFVFGSKTFPMYEVAKMRYTAAASIPAQTTVFITVAGSKALISEQELPAFIKAYNDKILELTNPDRVE